ncbi:GNAT family N-acetyltransferase [Nitrosomonas sp. ANs5]|uniref:GNAT family N-acetyltransferase n=1 Tax=Nitrosomonas sp. ANs5 TaxID=3423941 RepID=UPI003D33A989
MTTPVEIRELVLHEVEHAAAVLGRGMLNNPLHVRVFGGEAERRERALRRLFIPVLRQQMRKGIVLGAFVSGRLTGVTGMVPPKHCQPRFAEQVAVLLALIRGSGVRSSLRVFRWVRDWSRHDAAMPHWHLGPVAVDQVFQGQGIGSALLQEFCQRIDEHQTAGYLETDKPENVAFYQRFGFTVIDAHPVLGVRNWFMIRPAAR